MLKLVIKIRCDARDVNFVSLSIYLNFQQDGPTDALLGRYWCKMVKVNEKMGREVATMGCSKSETTSRLICGLGIANALAGKPFRVFSPPSHSIFWLR